MEMFTFCVSCVLILTDVQSKKNLLPHHPGDQDDDKIDICSEQKISISWKIPLDGQLSKENRRFCFISDIRTKNNVTIVDSHNDICTL